MNNIIVIGGDHHNTLGVIRALGEKGIYPEAMIVTRKGKTFVGKSKFISGLHVVGHDSEIVPYILSNMKQEGAKPIIICCHDGASSEIDIHADELKPWFILPGADEQGRITKLMNKKVMSDMAVACGFSIPMTIYPEQITMSFNKIPLPCIVKPLVSKNGTKEDIKICYGSKETKDAISKIGLGKVQLQQFIVKDFEYQLIGCSTGRDVIIPGVSRILRPCKGSNTSFLHYEPFEDNFCDIDKCKKFVKMTGYKGLFSMEFLRDKSGKDYFMEINFRNDGNAICVTAAGVNLPYIWYLACMGMDYDAEVHKTVTPKYIMPDMAELKLLKTGEISLWQYLSDLIKTDRFMEFDKRDIRPFWKMLQMKV